MIAGEIVLGEVTQRALTAAVKTLGRGRRGERARRHVLERRPGTLGAVPAIRCHAAHPGLVVHVRTTAPAEVLAAIAAAAEAHGREFRLHLGDPDALATALRRLLADVRAQAPQRARSRQT